MAACTFFGHSDVPDLIEPALQMTLTDLIENKNVDSFFVGTHGNFDALAIKHLKAIQRIYPHIHYTIVLAYITCKNLYHPFETIYPTGLENIHPKYAITARNHWMIEQSDYVITYVTRNVGGAAKFQQIAEKKKKIVLNLAITI